MKIRAISKDLILPICADRQQDSRIGGVGFPGFSLRCIAEATVGQGDYVVINYACRADERRKRMASKPRTFFTPEEYLDLERKAEYKSEYFNGEIFAMGGASPRHLLIVTNVVSELRSQLKKRPCTVYSTDLRVRVSPTGLYTYPDVVVVFGKPEFADDHRDTLINPTLIVEVLSKTTKNYDRGDKFEQYRKLNSLKEYLLIAQDKHHIERHVRQPDSTWVLSETSRVEDSIDLVSINCNLALGEIYDKVDQLEVEL